MRTATIRAGSPSLKTKTSPSTVGVSPTAMASSGTNKRVAATDKEKALEFKTKGNVSFQNGDYQAAIYAFTKGLELDPHNPNNYIFYSNRSAAFFALPDYRRALEDAELVLRLKPDWPKGYSRKGAALVGLKELEKAIDAYKEGLRHDPHNELLLEGLEVAQNALLAPKDPSGRKIAQSKSPKPSASATSGAAAVPGASGGPTSPATKVARPSSFVSIPPSAAASPSSMASVASTGTASAPTTMTITAAIPSNYLPQMQSQPRASTPTITASGPSSIVPTYASSSSSSSSSVASIVSNGGAPSNFPPTVSSIPAEQPPNKTTAATTTSSAGTITTLAQVAGLRVKETEWHIATFKDRIWLQDENKASYRPMSAFLYDMNAGQPLILSTRQNHNCSPFPPSDIHGMVIEVCARHGVRPATISVSDDGIFNDTVHAFAQAGIPLASRAVNGALRTAIQRFVLEAEAAEERQWMSNDPSGTFSTIIWKRKQAGILRTPGTHPHMVEGLLHNAAEYYRSKLYERFTGYVSLQILPTEETSIISLVGTANAEHGIAQYHSLAHLMESEACAGQAVSFLFTDVTAIPFDDVDDIERYHWEIAGPQAFPLALVYNPDHTTVRPSAETLRWFEIAFGALREFALQTILSAGWTEDPSQQTSRTVTVPTYAGQISAVITLPSKAAAAATAQAAANGGPAVVDATPAATVVDPSSHHNAAPPLDSALNEFFPASEFQGSRPGFVFHMGPRGVGYYPDPYSHPRFSTSTAVPSTLHDKDTVGSQSTLTAPATTSAQQAALAAQGAFLRAQNESRMRSGTAPPAPTGSTAPDLASSSSSGHIPQQTQTSVTPARLKSIPDDQSAELALLKEQLAATLRMLAEERKAWAAKEESLRQEIRAMQFQLSSLTKQQQQQQGERKPEQSPSENVNTAAAAGASVTNPTQPPQQQQQQPQQPPAHPPPGLPGPGAQPFTIPTQLVLPTIAPMMPAAAPQVMMIGAVPGDLAAGMAGMAPTFVAAGPPGAQPMPMMFPPQDLYMSAPPPSQPPMPLMNRSRFMPRDPRDAMYPPQRPTMMNRRSVSPTSRPEQSPMIGRSPYDQPPRGGPWAPPSPGGGYPMESSSLTRRPSAPSVYDGPATRTRIPETGPPRPPPYGPSTPHGSRYGHGPPPAMNEYSPPRGNIHSIY